MRRHGPAMRRGAVALTPWPRSDVRLCASLVKVGRRRRLGAKSMSDSPQRRHALDDEGCQAGLCLERHRLAPGDVRIDDRLAHSQGVGERLARDRVHGEQLAE